MPDHPRAPATLPDLALAAARFAAMPCDGFAAGTLLATEAGPRPVEQLQPGDRLITPGGGSIRLRHAALLQTPGPHPGAGQAGVVLLPPDALGPGRPRRALRLGAGQAVWLPDSAHEAAAHHALAAAGLLCGGAACRAGGRSPPLYALSAAAGPADPGDVVLAEGLACALRRPTRPEHDPYAGAALAAARRSQQHASSRHETAPPAIDGAVTLDTRQRLSGWAMDRAAPDTPLLLEVLLDDITIGFALADEPRPDLAMAGLGTGTCGFAFTLPPPSARRAPSGRLLRLHAVGNGASLPGTPLLILRAIGG